MIPVGRAAGAWLVRSLLPLAGVFLLAAPAGATPPLHVIPFPGTPDASPHSEVIFSSLRPSDVRSVIVTGSSSEAHSGHLVSLPDRAGTAFVPDRPFIPGERVKVIAALRSAAAGTASGAPGSRQLRFSFTVGIDVGWGGQAHGPQRGMPPASASGAVTSDQTPVQTFHSAPNIHPPTVNVTSDPDTASGDIFLTPHYSQQNGPMILDSRGRLVWFRPLVYATNLEVQHYERHPVLTWWQRVPPGGGEDVIVGRSYRTIATLHARYGYVADIHEFQISPRGTALIDAYVPVKANLSSVGGSSKGTIYDCVIQELDIKTGRLLWEWHALGHVPLTASYFGHAGSSPFDYFHLNSVQLLPNGNLLISARHTWSVYEIDKLTGKVIWTLGGKYSSFKLGPGAGFAWQHDAHLYPAGILSLFDDASDGVSQHESQSSAKLIQINTSSMTASLVRRYAHSPPLLADVEGSAQLLPNHDVFVGWGDQPDFSEYSPGGKQIFNGSFPLGVHSYRAYRFPWHGQPLTLPSMSVSSMTNGTAKVYASWNGATRVASWRVLGGSSRGALRSLTQGRRTGFETVMILQNEPRYLAVEALGAHGKVLGRSAVHVQSRT